MILFFIRKYLFYILEKKSTDALFFLVAMHVFGVNYMVYAIYTMSLF